MCGDRQCGCGRSVGGSWRVIHLRTRSVVVYIYDHLSGAVHSSVNVVIRTLHIGTEDVFSCLQKDYYTDLVLCTNIRLTCPQDDIDPINRPCKKKKLQRLTPLSTTTGERAVSSIARCLNKQNCTNRAALLRLFSAFFCRRAVGLVLSVFLMCGRFAPPREGLAVLSSAFADILKEIKSRRKICVRTSSHERSRFELFLCTDLW